MKRRVFLQGVAAGGAGVAAIRPIGAASAATGLAAPTGAAGIPATAPGHTTAETSVRADEMWQLLAPLAAGEVVGLGWRAAHLSDAIAGACVLTLAHDESLEEVRVHVCRKGDQARGVASSGELDFVLMNRADGSTPTDENLARVLNLLAELARRNEAQGACAPQKLMCHDARLSAHECDSSLT